MAFFFRLKLSQGMAVPIASLVLMKNGQPAASVPLQLAAPNAHGVIDHTAQLPLDALPVGDFVLRLVVKGGDDEVVREMLFRVGE